MRAAVYVRTSSPNQRFNFSIDAQIDLCLKHCSQRGWDATHVFIDECQSAKDTDRAKFKQMMLKAQEGRFDVLIFWKLDRLCRSLIDTVNTEKSLRGYGISLCSVTEYIDTTTSVGRFNFRNLASVAEFEREMIGERSRMGLHELAKQHKWPNPKPPLGYYIANGYLKVNPDEAAFVNHCFIRYLETSSMPKVVYELNVDGTRFREGGYWSVPTLRGILMNRLYIGEYSVAGYLENVPEYQIVKHSTFELAQRIRLRYQQVGSPIRTVEPIRRTAKMLRILEKFNDCHQPFVGAEGVKCRQ